MNLIAKLQCWFKGKHVMGSKFRRDALWYQSCKRCGKVASASEPVRRVKK
jgi:hypothetical protein